MKESSTGVSAKTTSEGPRTTAPWVFRIGGICLLGAGVAYGISAVLSIVIAAPPSGAELYLSAVSRHLEISRLNFWLWVASDVLLLPGAFALYLALRHIAKRTMIVGAGLLAVFAVLDAALTERYSLLLVADAQRYAMVAGSQRLAVLAAASHTLSLLPAATFLSYAVSSVGLLLVSMVMLRGVFTKPSAYAGIVAAVEGIVGGFYPLVPSLAVLLAPSLVAFALWALFSGRRLLALAGIPSPAVSRSA